MKRLSTAADIMVTKLITLSPETAVLDGIARLLENRVTGAPVVDRRMKYLGVFSEKCSMDVLVGAAHDFQSRRHESLPRVRAKDIMVPRLITLDPDMDVFEAINLLLSNHISGAPVVDRSGAFVGSFSEKTSMSVLLGAAYDQLPSSHVMAFIDADRGRTIDEDLDLLAIAQIFIDTPYRRLPVLRGDRVVGQISRRDVLNAAIEMAHLVPDYLASVRKNDADPDQTHVGAFMDADAETITEDFDLLRIATIFRTTPYRRLPVLRDETLAGLVSRRDVLHETRKLLPGDQKPPQKQSLYISAVTSREMAPIE